MPSRREFQNLFYEIDELRWRLDSGFSSAAPSPAERPQRWWRYINNSGQTVPAHGILRPDGVTAGVFQIERPDDFGCFGNFPVSYHEDVADGDEGFCTFDFPAIVLYDSAETPAFGELWGPVKDSFKLTKDSIGFQVLGDVDYKGTDLVLVNQMVITHIHGQYDGAGTVAQDATGTVSIYRYEDDPDNVWADAVWTDTTHNIEAVRNVSDVDITKGDRITLERDHFYPRWVAGAVECSP